MKPPNWIIQTPIAHRGLHSIAVGIPENSLAAFRKALQVGFAIECDLRESKDGEIFVFHDSSLKRMTGDDRTLSEISSQDLSNLFLAKTQERIPRLQDVFHLVQGQVPLLLEIKSESRAPQFEPKIWNLIRAYIESYPLSVAIQSFNPTSVHWFLKNAPTLPRGLIIGSLRNETNLHWSLQWALRNGVMIPWCRPDFLAIEKGLLKKPPFVWCRSWWKQPTLAWTIQSIVEENEVRRQVDNVIFEGYEIMA